MIILSPSYVRENRRPKIYGAHEEVRLGVAIFGKSSLQTGKFSRIIERLCLIDQLKEMRLMYTLLTLVQNDLASRIDHLR